VNKIAYYWKLCHHLELKISALNGTDVIPNSMACITLEEMRNACKILAGKPEWNGPLGRPKRI
jgi:hypothetical protein